MNHRTLTPRRRVGRRAIAALAVVSTVALASCGGSDDDTAAPTSSAPPTTEPAADPTTTDPPATPPPTEPDATEVPPTTEVDVTDELADEIQAILDASLEPGAIEWGTGDVTGPATGVSVAVRAPGHDDIFLASGTNVDGTPFTVDGSFSLGTNSHAVLLALGYQLIDDGVLDPSATVDAWLPTMPNADRITVQMLLDDTTGWKDFSDESTAMITADLSRSWTLDEVVATLADNPPLAEPGTFVFDGSRAANQVGLAVVIEQVTGKPLADVIDERFATPAGLDDTFLSDGSDHPADYQHGVFLLGGERLDTSMVPNISFFTYFVAQSAIISTLADSLEMVDMWSDGSLFSTDRVPGPEAFRLDRYDDDYPIGYGVPFNGYCPCEPDGDGVSVSMFGRRGNDVGTDVQLLHFPDGVSIVLHFNSQEWVQKADVVAVSDAIHETVAATL